MDIKIFICLFLGIFFPICAANAQPMNNDLKRKVVEQVERLKTISGSSEWRFFELPGRSSDPILELEKIGIVSIPYLIPFLSDASPTQAERAHGNGARRKTTVNEYVGYIINRIADYNFYLSKGKDEEGDDDGNGDLLGDEPLVDPSTILAFQTQIASWYQKNKNRSLAERKLDDLNDTFHYNRFAAYHWFGESKRKEYRLPLENKIKELLKGEVNSFKDSEMLACADALAQIGDPRSTAIVRKVTDHLSYWIYMSYRPVEEGRSGIGSNHITVLFQAYEALAKFGQKKEALIRLKELKEKYLEEMDQYTQNEFMENLEQAEKW
ncbi:hypothetical protein [Leptospira alstonii]